MPEIAELMRRDPLSLSREDVAAIVAEMRKARANFQSAPAATKKVKTTAVATPGLSLSSDDLGI